MEDYRQKMDEAVIETLEQMAFVQAFSIEAEDSSIDLDQCYSTQISVKSPIQGDFYLLISRDILEEVASSLFLTPDEAGAAGEAMDQAVVDVINELINTIAGRYISKILPQEKFELTLPEKVESISEANEVNDDCKFFYSTMEKDCFQMIYIEE